MSRRLLVEIILGLAVVIFASMWLREFFTEQPVGLAVEAKQDKVIIGEPTERLDCKPIVVYRDRIKEKVKLPDQVAADPNKRVLDAVRVDPDIRPHTITPVIDTRTGNVETYDTRLALPWLAISTRGEAGIAYGQNQDGRALRFHARQSFLNIKSLQASGVASYDMPLAGGSGSWFVGVQVAHRW